jgi:uncharacterized membrane protein YukC
MDRAYNFYRQFAQWTQEGVFFVTRQKKIALRECKKMNVEILKENYLKLLLTLTLISPSIYPKRQNLQLSYSYIAR